MVQDEQAINVYSLLYLLGTPLHQRNLLFSGISSDKSLADRAVTTNWSIIDTAMRPNASNPTRLYITNGDALTDSCTVIKESFLDRISPIDVASLAVTNCF